MGLLSYAKTVAERIEAQSAKAKVPVAVCPSLRTSFGARKLPHMPPPHRMTWQPPEAGAMT